MKGLKYYSSLLVFVLFTAQAFSQTGTSTKKATVSGYVIDAIDKSPMAGAIIVIDTLSGAGVISDGNGLFTISGIELNREKEFLVKYVGYKDAVIKVTPTSLIYRIKTPIVLDLAFKMKEVLVYGTSPIAEIKGDTTQYNAGAYKINPNASAGDLLAKMPGFKKNDDGSVSKDGEAVTKVLVDGRDFYRDDVSTALNSLPANIIESIQYVDDKSDESKFTGYDDGTRIKTINIVTKAKKTSAAMGEYYAGYGLGNKYMASANTNIFTKKDIISFGVGANNINSSPLAQTGYYGGGDVAGIKDAVSLKFNYDRKIKGGNISVTYKYEYGDIYVDRFTNQDYLVGNRVYQADDSITTVDHRHSLYLNYNQQLNKNNKLISRSNFTFSDAMSDDFRIANTADEDQPTLNNRATTHTIDETIRYNLRPHLFWFHNFSKKQSLMLGFRGTFSNDSSDKYLDSEIVSGIGTQEEITKTDQKIRDLANSNNMMAIANFTQKIGEFSGMNVRYMMSYDWSDNDKKTYVKDEFGNYTDINDGLSNTFARDYLNNTISLGYSYNQNGKHILNFGVGYKNSSLQNNMTYPTVLPTEKYTFHAPDARLFYKYKISETMNLNVFMRTYSSLPSITQLQDVLNVLDPLNVSIGNPNLNQSYNTYLSAYFRSANPEKSSSLSGYLSLRNIQNSFATHRQILQQDTEINGVMVQKGAQISTTENLDGYWNFRLGGTYAVPIKAIKSNINTNLRYGLSQLPSIYDNEEYTSLQNNVNLNVSIVSNIRPEIDFTVGIGANYSNTMSTQDNIGINNAITQEVSAKVNWIFWKGFFVNVDYEYRFNYFSNTPVDQPHQHILNAAIGKSFLNNSLELRVSAFDILNQYRSIINSQSAIYVQDVTSNNLTRYFAFSLRYKFNTLQGASNLRSSSPGGFSGGHGRRRH